MECWMIFRSRFISLNLSFDFSSQTSGLSYSTGWQQNMEHLIFITQEKQSRAVKTSKHGKDWANNRQKNVGVNRPNF